MYYTSHFKIYSDIPVTEITITGRMSATGQRWVNELAKFKSSIHYSPGKQMYFNRYLTAIVCKYNICRMYGVGTTLISSYQVKVILDAAESQHHQADIWLVCLNTIMIEEQKKILHKKILTTSTKCFTISDLKKETTIRTLDSTSENHCQRKCYFNTC